MKKPAILIVDDTPSNIHILVESLGDEYDIKVAKNGRSAIEIAGRTDKPDLILLDIMMPGMDGYEVCMRLKKSESTHDIPVIFLTAKNDPADEEYGLSIGAVDYISKPFVPSITKARIKTHLALKFQRDELVRQKEDLKNAFDQIKILRGFIPICSSCKKIRDDKGYWNGIEKYISDHSEAVFSHSICPDCIDRLYPEYKD